MEKRDFKFELGNIVTHITDKHERCKMIIMGRSFIEYNNGVQQLYYLSSMEHGQVMNHKISAEELILFIEEIDIH